MATTDADPRDDLLVAALGEGLSYEAAGKVAGCSKATVLRRMRAPEFRATVVAVREERAEEGCSLLEGLAVRAAERVSSLVDAESEFVALKAALAVLDRAEQRRAARATEDRLKKLEELVAELLEGQRRGLRGVA